jgi:ribA/ribD-fused uncharacterized protein
MKAEVGQNITNWNTWIPKMAIKFYKTKEPYGFLNNFYPSRFFLYSRWWKWVEAPYQAMKTIDYRDWDKIQRAETPRDARNLGQTVAMHDSWNTIKIEVMYQCCLAKFTQNRELMEQLLATDNEELIEDSVQNSDPAHRDSFWGNGPDGSGENNLGKVLMRVRKDLRNG